MTQRPDSSHEITLWDSAPLRIIHIAAVIEAIAGIFFWTVAPKIFITHDTLSYIWTFSSYSWSEPLSLVGYLRTPIYPLILGVCDAFALHSDALYLFVAIVQWGVVICSIKYFARLGQMIVHKKAILYSIKETAIQSC